MKRKLPRLLSASLPLLLILSSGCTRKIYVTRDRYLSSRDSSANIRIRTDTIIEKDSLFVAQRGDTLIRETYRWRTRDRLRVDTIVRWHHDTVRCVEQKEAAVSGQSGLTWKERHLRRVGKGALWIIFAVCCMLAIRFLYRRNP